MVKESLKCPEILRNTFHGVFSKSNSNLKHFHGTAHENLCNRRTVLNNRITNNGKTYWRKMLITFLFYL